MPFKFTVATLWIMLCTPALAQQPASVPAKPTAAEILDTVGGPFADVLARFGAPESGFEVTDLKSKSPAVLMDYTAFAFKVRNKKVVAAEFRSRWEGGTFRDVKLFDTIEQVTQKLGKADSITKIPGSERHTWVDAIKVHDLRVLFLDEHGCVVVSLVAADSAP